MLKIKKQVGKHQIIKTIALRNFGVNRVEGLHEDKGNLIAMEDAGP